MVYNCFEEVVPRDMMPRETSNLSQTKLTKLLIMNRYAIS
jgi:hypothetical protein